MATNSDNVNGTTGAVALNYYGDSTDYETLYKTTGGDQSNSYFSITSSVDQSVIFGSYVRRIQLIEGNFKVKFYRNNNPSDVIEITDGEFKLNVTFD